jgi:hypothetical protein
VTIPHGLLFHEPSLYIDAVSRYWDAREELGCHWLDPELPLAVVRQQLAAATG